MRAPRSAEDELGRAVLQHDGLGDGRGAGLAGSDGARLSRLGIEAAHAVVVHEAEPRGEHAGSVTERMAQDYGVAVLVDNGDLGGVLRLQ